MFPIPFDWMLLNNLIGLVAPSVVMDPSQTDQLLTSRFMFMMKESGYLHFQATKPDTVGMKD